MATETLYADAHLAGDFPTPENAIGNTPTTWAGTTNANTNYTSRWSLADPVDSLTSGAQQTVNVWTRKGTNSGTPTIALNLYIAGTLVASRTAQNVNSTTGETISVTFTAAEMTPPVDAEIEIVQTSAGGNPNTRNSAEVAYIEWLADTSPEVTPTTAPVLSVDAIGETTVDLSWTAVDGVDTYELQRDLVTIQNTSALTRNDTGLAQGTSYDYQVRAVNSAGSGPWSDTVTVTTLTTVTGSSTQSLSAFSQSAAGTYAAGSTTGPYFSDDFNRADEVPVAAPWVVDQPLNYSLISNTLRGGQTGAGWEVAYVETSENGSTSDKLVVRADVTLATQGNVGLGLFVTNDGNWIGPIIDNNSFNIRKASADAVTVLTSDTLHNLTVDGVATYQLEAEYTPSTGVLRFLIDGVEKETYTLTADEQTEYESRTTHGLFNFSSSTAEVGNTVIDNFAVTDKVVSNILPAVMATVEDAAVLYPDTGWRNRSGQAAGGYPMLTSEEAGYAGPVIEGTQSILNTAAGGGANCEFQSNTSATGEEPGIVLVDAGAEYTFRIEAQALTTGRNALVFIEWFDNSMVSTGSAAVSSETVVGTDGPVTLHATGTAPAGTTQARLVIRFVAPAAGEQFVADRASMHLGSSTGFSEPTTPSPVLGNTGSFVPSTNVASHTTQFSVGAGANRVLVVFIPQKRSPLRSISSITFNGVAGTVSAPITDASNSAQVAAYYWLEADLPVSGTYDCVVTFDNANNVFSLLALEFENAPQVVPSGIGDSGSVIQVLSVSDTTETDSLSVAAMIGDTNNVGTPATPTISGEQSAGPSADFSGLENQTLSGYILTNDGSPTIEWSTTETWDPAAVLMFTFEEAGAGDPGTFAYEAWGHSYLANDAPSPGAHYRDLIVVEDADASALNNHANGGFTVPEMAAELVGLTTDDTWTIGTTGARVLIDGVLNDLQEKDSVTKALAAVEEGVRAMCATVSAASFTPHTDAAFSYTGTWNGTSSLTSARSGSQNSTSDPTATVSITVNGPDHFLHVFGKDDAVSVGANFDITVDGSPFGSFTTRDKMLQHPTDLGPSFVNMVIPLRDLGAGSHDIVLTKTDGGTLNFDGLSTMAATDRTPVILVKDQYLDWVASPGTYGSDAGLDAYNARLDLVAAEFDNVFVADPSEGWDIATMISADNVHLSNAGHRHFADAILAVDMLGMFSGSAESVLSGFVQSASGTHTTGATNPGFSEGFTGGLVGQIVSASIVQALQALDQSVSGTTSTPTSTGTGASTLVPVAQTASGAHTEPEFVGTAASLLPVHDSAAEATHTPPTYTATVTSTLSPVLQSASGSPAAPIVTATASSDLSPVALAASGTVADPIVAGAASSDLPALSQTAEATHVAPATDGSVTSGLPALTQASVGTHAAPVAAGTVASTLPTLTQDASGVSSPPVVVGTASSFLPSVTQATSGTFAALSVPRNLTATTFNYERIDLVWDPVAGASGYDIERSWSSGGVGAKIVFSDHVGTTFSDTGLEPATQYSYRVRAVQA